MQAESVSRNFLKLRQYFHHHLTQRTCSTVQSSGLIYPTQVSKCQPLRFLWSFPRKTTTRRHNQKDHMTQFRDTSRTMLDVVHSQSRNKVNGYMQNPLTKTYMAETTNRQLIHLPGISRKCLAIKYVIQMFPFKHKRIMSLICSGTAGDSCMP